MKQHTDEFKQELINMGKQIDSIITYTNNNQEVTLHDELYAVTPHYEANLLKSVMKQLDIESSVDIPLETVVNYKFGVKVGNDYEYLDYGNYVVYKSEKKEDADTYLLTCYDKMLYAMKDYENMNITYPITIRNYLNTICTYLGLNFANNGDTFANYDKEIQSELYLNYNDETEEYEKMGYTFRDVLDELAQVTASMICINNNDELEVKYPNNAGTEVTLQGKNLTITEHEGNKLLGLKLYGETTQTSRSGRNLYNYQDTTEVNPVITVDSEGWVTATYNNTGNSTVFLNYYTNNLDLSPSTNYAIFTEIKNLSGNGLLYVTSNVNTGQFTTNTTYYINGISPGTKKNILTTKASGEDISNGLRSYVRFGAGESGSITFRISVLADTTVTVNDFEYEAFGVSPSPNYPSSINNLTGNINIEISDGDEQTQTVTFPLSSTSLTQGSYLANDGIHNVRKKVIFDGSNDENWIKQNTTYSGFTRFNISKSDVKIWGKSVCNYFIDNNGTPAKNVCTIAQTTATIIVCPENSIATTLEAWKTWLSNNPITVEYELAEEEITPYTTTQQTAWDNIKNLTLYEGTNNIASNSIMYFKYTKQYEKIDKKYLKDVNVKFGEKYGPINSVVLSRGAESDNVYLRDEESVTENGLCEIKIVDNQIMNWNDRSDYLQGILDAVDGIEYYINDFTSPGILYLEVGDFYNIEVDETLYKCLMINDEIDITQGIQEIIHTELPEQSETDYSKADKTDRRINQTYLIVNKQNQKIESLISQIGDRSQKTTTITQDIDGVNSRVEDLEDLTTENESFYASLEFENINQSQPIEIKIHPTTTNISYLYPQENLYPSDTLYMPNRILRFTNTETSEVFDYELPEDLLVETNSGTYDELYMNCNEQICRVTKRCGLERSANIFNPKYRKENDTIYCIHGTATETNGVYTITPTSQSYVDLWKFTSNTTDYYNEDFGQLFEFEEDNYAISFTSTKSGQIYVTYFDTNKKVIGSTHNISGRTHTINKNDLSSTATYFTVCIEFSNSSTYSFTCKIMVNEGTTALPYEQYGNVHMVLLAQEETHNYSPYPVINLTDGDYTVELLGYSNAYLKAVLMIQNAFTKQFATRVEMHSEITQTAQEINAEVVQKVDENEIIAKINAAIQDGQGIIRIEGNQVIINSDYFTLNADGSIEATSGGIGGFDLGESTFEANLISEKMRTYTYTSNDTDRIRQIIGGQISPTSSDYDKYDFDYSGEITTSDWLIALNIVNGTETGQGTFILDTTNSERAIRIESDRSGTVCNMGLFGSYINRLSTGSMYNKSGIRSDYGFTIAEGNNSRGWFAKTSHNGVDTTGIMLSNNYGVSTISMYGSTGGIECVSLTQTSKEENKKNFEKLENGLDIVKATDIYKYNLTSQNDNDKKHIGFVIGEKYKYANEITAENDDGVDIYSMISVAYKAIQEQQEQIEQLQKEIKELKGENNG